MWTVGRLTGTILAALTDAAVPLSQAQAQQSAPPELMGSNTNGARAAELRAQATALFPDRSRYPRAAELLQQASALTPVEDPARADDLRVAANLLYYTGEVSEAQDAMVQAAEAALARGDIDVAANCFIDAGWLAAARHGNREARELAYRALHLTASPFLTNDQREGIRKRLALAGLEGVKISSSGAVRSTGWSLASQRVLPSASAAR